MTKPCCSSCIVLDHFVQVTFGLYFSLSWSLTVGEEHSLMMFENRVLKTMFGTTWDEVAGGW